MEISLKGALVAQIVKEKSDILKISHWDIERFKKLDKEDGYKSTDVFKYNLIEIPDSKLSPLVELLEKFKASAKTIDAVKRWIKVLKDPANGDVSTVQGIEKVFKKLLAGLPVKWLLMKGEDGEVNPVLVKEFKYHAPTRGDYARFEIKVVYGYLMPAKDEDGDAPKAYSTSSEEFTFYKSDITKNDEDDIPDYLKVYDGKSNEDSDEEEDDELTDDEPVKKSKPKKAVSIKMSELLAMRDLYIPTKEDIVKYHEAMLLQAKIAKQIGAQYLATGDGYDVRKGYRELNLSLVNMSDDGIPNKIVVDTFISDGEILRSASTEAHGTQPIPYHPYVRVYDITKYRSVAVHVSKMAEYEYKPDLMDSLILPKEQKDLLNALISGEVTFNDIIAGKSGGIIIQTSGAAGTGKTLTAEILAEVVGKPLYQVQSAQLGLKPEEIEKNLYKILKRAARWNAVLLLDECDAYVYERGEDMEQNAVVSVFLRLLEYYTGILFIATNRHDKIDAAILSRLTAHIKYGIPTKENQIKIFDVVGKSFKIKTDHKETEKILDKYPNMVGRDIRNLLKLLKKFNHKEKGEFELKADMTKAVEQFIPFVNKSDAKIFNPSSEMQKA